MKYYSLNRAFIASIDNKKDCLSTSQTDQNWQGAIIIEIESKYVVNSYTKLIMKKKEVVERHLVQHWAAATSQLRSMHVIHFNYLFHNSLPASQMMRHYTYIYIWIPVCVTQDQLRMTLIRNLRKKIKIFKIYDLNK